MRKKLKLYSVSVKLPSYPRIYWLSENERLVSFEYRALVNLEMANTMAERAKVNKLIPEVKQEL
jgi:hypothetical protein